MPYGILLLKRQAISFMIAMTNDAIWYTPAETTGNLLHDSIPIQCPAAYDTPATTPDLIHDFKHSPSSTTFTSSLIRCHDMVRWHPEKTRSGSADISGIDRISIANRERLG